MDSMTHRQNIPGNFRLITNGWADLQGRRAELFKGTVLYLTLPLFFAVAYLPLTFFGIIYTASLFNKFGLLIFIGGVILFAISQFLFFQIFFRAFFAGPLLILVASSPQPLHSSEAYALLKGSFKGDDGQRSFDRFAWADIYVMFIRSLSPFLLLWWAVKRRFALYLLAQRIVSDGPAALALSAQLVSRNSGVVALRLFLLSIVKWLLIVVIVAFVIYTTWGTLLIFSLFIAPFIAAMIMSLLYPFELAYNLKLLEYLKHGVSIPPIDAQHSAQNHSINTKHSSTLTLTNVLIAAIIIGMILAVVILTFGSRFGFTFA